MKKITFIMFILLSLCASVVFSADVMPTPTVPTAAATAIVTTGLFGWFTANSTVVLGLVLALSEVLSLIPAFKGNGILDTIIKAAQALSEKTTTPPA